MRSSSCIKKTITAKPAGGKQKKTRECSKGYGTKAQGSPVTCGECIRGLKLGRKITCTNDDREKLFGKENDKDFSCGQGILRPSFNHRQAGKEPSLMKIHKNLEQIKTKKISDMNLFELSIHSLMPSDTFREIRNRLMQIQTCLEVNDTKAAKAIVDSFFASPQKRSRT